jgi:hypothetical protein
MIVASLETSPEKWALLKKNSFYHDLSQKDLFASNVNIEWII